MVDGVLVVWQQHCFLTDILVEMPAVLIDLSGITTPEASAPEPAIRKVEPTYR
jgi:hypothetical protein